MAGKPFKAFVMVEIEGEAYNEHSLNGIIHRIKTAIELGAKRYASTGWRFNCSHLPEIKFVEEEVENERGEPRTETGRANTDY